MASTNPHRGDETNAMTLHGRAEDLLRLKSTEVPTGPTSDIQSLVHE